MTYVALMRLPTAEIYLVRNFLDVVAARGLAYKLAEAPAHSANADLVILDADNHVALSLWKRLRQERPNTTAILIARTPPADDGQIWIQRPLNSMKLLAAFGKANTFRSPEARTTVGQRGKASVTPIRGLQGARVLVIDNSATARKQLEITLSEQGVQVFCADSGEAGLHVLSDNNVDLVFLDVILPGADGYQICKTIRKNKLKQRVPVVMLTSKSSPFDRFKGSLAGCDSYLTKPVELQRLVEVMEKFRLHRVTSTDNTSIPLVAAASARAMES